MRIINYLSVPAIALIVMFSECTGKESKKTAVNSADTVLIWVDSSLRVPVNEQKKAFENIYKFPKLELIVKNEDEILRALLNNSVNVAVLHRKLNKKEIEYLSRKEEFVPKQYEFALDAYVFITADNNPLEELTADDLRQYFAGQAPGTMTLAVESGKSQSVQFLKDRFSISETQLNKLYATGNLTNLMSHLRTAPGAIAVIPFSYVSDLESSSTMKLLENLKVIPVAYTDSAGNKRLVSPSQSSISTREYPFISPLVLVNCNMKEKSGTNFVNFIFKPKAQRLILKCGLCPVIFPGRELNIHTN